MLALSIPVGEYVDIGDNIRVRIYGVRDNGDIKIAIEAPREVHIVRSNATKREPREHGTRET